MPNEMPTDSDATDRETDSDATDREHLEQLTAAWKEYDRTFDPSLVTDFLADDITLLSPCQSPIEGKDAAVAYLDRPKKDAEVEIEQYPTNIVVGADLAVVQVVVEGTVVPADADEPEDVSHKGLDVYRRDEEGEWEQCITIWNEQA